MDKRLKTHESSTISSSSDTWPGSKPSRFIIANGEAFQSLLQKLRAKLEPLAHHRPGAVWLLVLQSFGPLRRKRFPAMLALDHGPRAVLAGSAR